MKQEKNIKKAMKNSSIIKNMIFLTWNFYMVCINANGFIIW